MVEQHVCSFCGKQLEPGTGKMFVKKDGTIFFFCSTKCQNNHKLGRVPRRVENLPEARVTEQYKEHLSKPFFPSLKKYIMGGPCFLMVWEGRNVVVIVRKVIGSTNPAEAAPGTIRGDFGIDIGRNVIHASDSPESAAKEIAIHFKNDEIVSYTRIDESVVYEY
jgi:nucleoside-diphosphate kinase